MDDRSYRGGCPPYCTCVKCVTNFSKKKNKRNFSKNYVYALIGGVIFLLLFFLVVYI